MVEDADRGRGPLRYGLPPNVSQYSDPYGRKDSILEPRGRFDDSEEAYLHGMSEEETQRRGWKAGGPYPRDPANPLDNPYPRRVFHPIEIPGTRGRLIDPEIVNREATVNRAMSAIEQASFSSLSVVPCVLTRVVERRASRGLAGSDGRRDPASRLNHNFGMDRPDGRQRCVPHIERDPNHPRYGLQRTHDGTSAGVPLNRKRPSRRDDLELRDRLGAVYDETAPSLTSDRGLGPLRALSSATDDHQRRHANVMIKTLNTRTRSESSGSGGTEPRSRSPSFEHARTEQARPGSSRQHPDPNFVAPRPGSGTW